MTTLPSLVAISTVVVKILLVFHVIKQNNETEGSGDYNDTSLSRYVTTLPSLLAMGTVVVEIKWF